MKRCIVITFFRSITLVTLSHNAYVNASHASHFFLTCSRKLETLVHNSKNFVGTIFDKPISLSLRNSIVLLFIIPQKTLSCEMC